MKIEELFSVRGKVALVTGGSRGIGEMIARAYVENGVKVYITARKADACDAVASDLSKIGECISIPGDVSRLEEIDRLGAEIEKHESKLDILVNNAGASWGADFVTFPESGWDKVMDINVKAAFFLNAALVQAIACRRFTGGLCARNQHWVDRRHAHFASGSLFLCRLQGGDTPPDPHDGEIPCEKPHRGQRDRARLLSIQDDRRDSRNRKRGHRGRNSNAALGARGGYGGSGNISGFARGRLFVRIDGRCRWRLGYDRINTSGLSTDAREESSSTIGIKSGSVSQASRHQTERERNHEIIRRQTFNRRSGSQDQRQP